MPLPITAIRLRRVAAFLVCLALAPQTLWADEQLIPVPRTRTFLFTYEAVIEDLPEAKAVRLWLPVPSSDSHQQVELVDSRLPCDARYDNDPEYGNRILHVEAAAGAERRLAVSLTYRVCRSEFLSGTSLEEVDRRMAERFVQPDSLVPTAGKPLLLLDGKQLPGEPLARARLFYDLVYDHMRYSKEGSGWGRGDAVWACDSRYGNCTDFHSLFISLARAHRMPAKFEIGFPLPDMRGAGEIAGYHCWAKFSPDGKYWIPVDISEADKNPQLHEYYFGSLTENRVTFSVGRDLALVPKQDGPPLNFFVYPYAEVDGQPYPAEKIGRKFTFRDEAGECGPVGGEPKRG